MFCKRLLIGLFLLFNTSAFAADSTVSSLTAASALGGTELFYCVQSGDKKCTTNQISTFILASPTITGTAIIPTPFTLGVTSVSSTGTQFNYLNAATGTTGTTSTNLVFSGSPTIASLTVTGAFTATGLVTNADLASAATTVNGQTCTLGSTCTVTASATAVTVGTTTVGSGTTTRILYDNAGTLGEYTLTGTGTVVAMQTSPTFVTDLTTPIAKLSGTSNQLVFQSGGVTGTLSWAPATSGKTITLPNGTTDFTGTSGIVQQASSGAAFSVGSVALTNLATQATNTIVGNATSGTVVPTALAIGTCSTASSALIWTTNTGFSCNTSITANAVAVGGITGLGTGVATALAINVGSAGAPVTFNGAGGTPTSMTATNLSGTAASLTAGTATNAINSGITDDTTTNATMNLAWVTSNTGNLPLKATSTKLTFNPSTGVLSSTSFTGAGTGLTGTAASLTAGIASAVAASGITGTTLASNVVTSSLTSVGTLTGGATGAGFTVALTTSTITGTLPNARLGLPYFSAYVGTDQTVTTATLTKVSANTKISDSNSWFDATTNFRYTPLLAGTYRFKGNVECQGTAVTVCQASIYKNGSIYTRSILLTASGTFQYAMTDGLLVMNGSTDYVELFVQENCTGTCKLTGGTGPIATAFEGHFISP